MKGDDHWESYQVIVQGHVESKSCDLRLGLSLPSHRHTPVSVVVIVMAFHA